MMTENNNSRRKEAESAPAQSTGGLLMWVALVVSLAVVSLAVSSTYQRTVSSKAIDNMSFFENLNNNRKSTNAANGRPLGDSLSSGWQVYKVTSSISSGTYSDMMTFLNTYIASSSITNLGCTTEKVAASLFSPFELHFVDSAIFNDLSSSTSRDLEDWATFGNTLNVDTTEYNAFFHNKVQVFVDDLQPHYDIFKTDGISTMKRLSTSTQSGSDITENDIAHMGIWLPNAVTMLELVGPSSTLDSDSLSEFSEWADNECPQSHVLQSSLDSYLDTYSKQADTISTAVSNWETSTGLPTPMGIQVSIPTSSISSMQNTIDLVTSMNSATVTYNEYTTATSSGEASQCLISGFNVGTIYVNYVENNAVDGVTSLSVSDWASDIEECHAEYVNNDSTMTSWDRYLDSHIGMYVDASDDCESYYDYISDKIADNDGNYQYGLRVATTYGVGTHYYTGTDGIRSWEFNANDCAMDDQTDICGCSGYNAKVAYEEATGLTSCTSDSTRRH